MDPGFHGVRTHSRMPWIRDFTGSERTAGRLWDAVNPGFHGVRTRWIRGFMTFQLAGRTRNMRLTVPVRPEPSFGNEPPGCGH